MAREAGVSKAAVSFAFNNPARLASETAERIRRVAEELGYRPHPVARMLTAGSTATIGILSPQALAQVFGNPFFPLFAEGVATVAEDRGFGLLFISPLHGSLERALGRATVDGVIVIGLDHRHPEVEAVRRAALPVVLVDATNLSRSLVLAGQMLALDGGQVGAYATYLNCGLFVDNATLALRARDGVLFVDRVSPIRKRRLVSATVSTPLSNDASIRSVSAVCGNRIDLANVP